MQSFYRRFVRDFMRYKDDIQCAGSDLVATVRAEARHFAPHDNGEYYALHIRRGDLQFKVLLANQLFALTYTFSVCVCDHFFLFCLGC